MSSPASKSVQSPLNLILPIKSWVGLQELDAVLHPKLREIIEASNNIGTLHFARFFNFHDNNQMGFSRLTTASTTIEYLDLPPLRGSKKPSIS